MLPKRRPSPSRRLAPEPEMVSVVFVGGCRAKVTALVADKHVARGEAEYDKKDQRQNAQSGR